MMNNQIGLAIAVLMTVSFLSTACAPKREKASKVNSEWIASLADSYPKELYLGPEDSLISFDAYLTWDEYNCLDFSTSEANYYWNGEFIGQGRLAIDVLLARMRELPVRSVLLIYPSHHLFGDPAGSPPYCFYPFANQIDRLVKVGENRKLTFVYSYLDHKGNAVGKPWRKQP